ncbi:hypothetical protein [Halomonas sp. DWK9]|uniref:5'-methylthioadenosine/S-adenosylhomocysteine nucleosidase family protein n=1 Tax=Halomonas sp. DWK9 TaxID=3060155 RepID=UPI00287F6934|nr:hypothetical protein [Halomonas sp. DWK9]
MNILIFEDDFEKKLLVERVIKDMDVGADIIHAAHFQDFMKNVYGRKFDLIVADLIAPQFKGYEAIDLTQNIIEAVRAPDSINLLTSVLALTRYDDKAEANFKGLNIKDISVVTFSENVDEWQDSLRSKVVSCMPPITFDFIVVCALAKEVDGFIEAGYEVGYAENISGLECRRINIGEKHGAIVKLPRMGLVTCSIISTLAIEIFKPKLICMSGICAGIEGKANIYDVIIPDACHQHDNGKWSEKGLEPEVYNVLIPSDVRLSISSVLTNPAFLSAVTDNVKFNRSEIPLDVEQPNVRISLAPASSGSAVIASTEMAHVIKEQHRKNTAFEMESYALYEAARLSRIQPKYFSAKAVVDDGGETKGDNYHRAACIISAKTVFNLILRNVGFS